MDSILSIRFNCFLEFSPMMGEKFVYATTHNKGTLLQQCWMSKAHCPLTGLLLQLDAPRLIIDFVILDFVCRV